MGLRAPVALAVMCLVSAAYAESPPTLDEAIAEAAAADKPLLLEFQAEWCAPCREFTAKTLPDPRVQTALKNVVLVSYDADDKAGHAVTAKYSIRTFPTFVVVDTHGVERERYEGAPLGESGIQGFVELIGRSRFAGLDAKAIVREVEAHPKDIALRLSGAKWFADHDQIKAALVQYDAVAGYNGATAAERMMATKAAERIRRGEQRKQQLVAEKRALVTASPRDVAIDDVRLATVLSTMSAADADQLMAPVLEAQTDMSRLDGLVYVALAAGAKQQALAAAKRIVAAERTPRHLDTLAECYYSVGDRKQAVAIEDEALRLAKDTKLLRTLADHRKRFATGTGVARSVRLERARAAALWQQMTTIDQLKGYVPVTIGD